MHIRSLTLENVKSYADGRIDFAQGTNAIVGHNGAGKSTILEAIGFALFDHIGYKQADFVKEGARTATVTVRFISTADEREYEVVRRCGASSSYAVHDPELDNKICEGRADVLIFLREHLGADTGADLTQLFTKAVGVPQGTLTAAFLESTSQRKTTFDPLLRVEEYRKAWEGLREPLRLLADRQNEVNVRISGLEGRLERLSLLEEQAALLEQETDAARRELARTGEQLAGARERRAGLESQRAAIAALRAAAEQARQQVEMNRRQAESAARRLAETESAHTAAEANRAGHRAYQRGLAEKEELDAQSRSRQQVRDQMARLDKELSLAQAEVTRQQAALGEIEQAEAAVAALAPAVAEQAGLEEDLRRAEQQVARLADARRLSAQAQAECAQAEAYARQVQEQLAQAGPLEKAVAAAEAAVNDSQTGMSERQSQLARQQAEGDGLRKQIAGLQQADGARCPVCEEPLSDERRKELLARNSRRLNELEKERKSVQAEIAGLEKSLRQAQAEVKAQQSALRRLPRADELQRAEERLAAARSAQAEAEKAQREVAAAAQEADPLRAQLAALGDPRRQQEFAARTAARRAEVEAALARQQKVLDAGQERAGLLQQQLAGFAGLDDALAQAATAIAQHRSADDIYRRNEQAAAGLEERRREAADVQTLLAASQERLQEASAALAAQESAFDETVYREAAAEEERLRNRQGSLEGQLSERKRRQAEVERELADLARRREEMDEALAERSRLQEQAERLESLRRILREAGPYVTKALVQQISFGAGQLFSEIMQDHSRHLRWDEEYAVLLEVEGRERSFAQLSGGEQMAAALSVRLALLREMSDIQVAFFDEPTSNLDETRRESLARQILGIEGFRQLFVISHDDTFEQATQNLVRVQKVNGVSVIVDPT